MPGLRPGVDVPSALPADRPRRPAAPPPAPYGRGGYAFLSTGPDGDPIAFDPCRPIHYVVNSARAPQRADQLLSWAFERLGAASGLRFVPDGHTNEQSAADRLLYQPDRYGDRWAPVLIHWTDGAQHPALSAEVLGQAGPVAFGRGRGHGPRYVTGTAAFNGPAVAELLQTGREEWARAVLLHELGHLVGLDHVSNPYQVMHPVNALPLTSYRDGDLRGLAKLGRGRCFHDY